MGLSPAADLLGFAIFQMMQTRLGTAGGAATQMVVILTSLAYMPGFGIASAGTTLVGQSIGAGALDWAQRVGNRVILLAALYMGGIGVLIALGGRWILPFFTGAHDADASAAARLGVQLLWLAAGYQFFDGLNLGSSLCLRGAGDVRVPAALVLVVSLLLFVPLAHSLTFAPGAGLGAFPAAVRLGRLRRLGGGAHLRHSAGLDAVPALALAGLAGDPDLKNGAEVDAHYPEDDPADAAAAARGPAACGGIRGVAVEAAHAARAAHRLGAAGRCARDAVAVGDADGCERAQRGSPSAARRSI